ncbi:MAG: LLM class flavin-dependent oxidoreductase [Acidimicrobiales bacterium]
MARDVTFGLGLYTGQRGAASTRPQYRDAIALAHAAEAAGFDAFWVSEHHGLDDGYLPSPLTLLAAIAGVTERITLGTGLVIAPLHHPLRIAEDAAMVDQLSGGRLVLGLGIGYVDHEFRMFGSPWPQRGARLAETVEVLRRAWTGEPFSFEGRTMSFADVRVTPRPFRDSGIPIWLGGYATPAVARAGRIADGHLTGRGEPHVIDAATAALQSVRRPEQHGFVRGVNIVCMLDEPGGHAASARRAFAAQQLRYERIQVGRDTYSSLVADPRPDQGLAAGSIDHYIQASGTAGELAASVRRVIDQLDGWRAIHIVLRLVFPGEDLDRQLERIDLVGRRVLQHL